MIRLQKMHSYLLAVVLFSGVAYSGVARASAFGEENATLTAILLESIAQGKNIYDTLENAKYMLKAANEGLSLARQGYREAKTLLGYSLQDLYNDLQEGLFEAFPDLREINRDANLIKDQFGAGSDNFFNTYMNSYDSQMSDRLRKVMKYGYRRAIWPVFFPDMDADTFASNPVKVKILKMYNDSGQMAEWAVKTTAMSTVAKRIKEWFKEAQDNKSRAEQIAATDAMLSHAALEAADQTRDILATKQSNEMTYEELQKNANKNLSQGIGDSIEDLLRPGAMNKKVE